MREYSVTQIELRDSDRNQIVRNFLDEGGIALLRSHGNVLRANLVDLQTYLDASNDNEIVDNNFREGLALIDSDHNSIFGNRMDADCSLALWIDSSARNRLLRNSIRGARLHRLDRAEFVENDLAQNSCWGGPAIEVQSSSRVVLRRNRVRSGEDGVFVDRSSRFVRLLENQVFDNRDDGIDVETRSAFLRGNAAFDNGDLGIEAVEGVKDLGHNSAEGNGNADQCLNVACE